MMENFVRRAMGRSVCIPRSTLFVILFLTIARLYQRVETLTVTVLKVECVSQWVEHDHDQVTGNFVVVEKDGDWDSDVVDVEMEVTSPSGGLVMQTKSRGGEMFAFRAIRKGHYKFCFHNPTSFPEEVSFSIHVGHIPQTAEVAKDEHFFPVEVKIAQLRESLESISLEQAYLKRRDMRHKKTNESTRRRLLWYTLLEYLTLISASLAQVYLIQRLFSKRLGYNKF